MIPSSRWLAIGEGLYYAIVAELNSGANWISVKGIIDALQWRMERQVTELEFSALFMAWKHEKTDPSWNGLDENDDEFNNQPNVEDDIVVSSAQFCTELNERALKEEDLNIMFGIVVNETNKLLLNSIQDPELMDFLKMRIALAEKVFFKLDTIGRGYITIDDMLNLVLINRRQMIENSNRKKMFNLSDICQDCVDTFNEFGSNDFYNGIITLKRFKALCIKSKGSKYVLNDMTLQKLLISLNNASSYKINDAWSNAISYELELNNDEDNVYSIQLARFLSIRGSRIRYQVYKPNRPFGTDEEIRVLWESFHILNRDEYEKELFHKLERVVFRYVSILNETLETVFPNNFIQNEQVFFCDDDDNDEMLNAELESQFNTNHNNKQFHAPTTNIVHNDNNEIEEDEFDDAMENDSNDDDKQKSISSPIGMDDMFVSNKDSINDGAYYIEAYRLFQSEKAKILGISPNDASKLWQSSTSEERKLYIDMAKSIRKRPSIYVTQNLKKPAHMICCKISREHIQFLETAAKMRTPSSFAMDDNSSNWTTFTIDSVLEHVLSSRFSYSNFRQVNPSNMYDLNYHGEKPTLDLYHAATVATKPLNEGILQLQIGSINTGQRIPFHFKLEVEICKFAQYDMNSNVLIDSMDLNGCTICTSLASLNASPKSISYRFILTSRNNEKSWTLYAKSQNELDEWVHDISFAISIVSSLANNNLGKNIVSDRYDRIQQPKDENKKIVVTKKEEIYIHDNQHEVNSKSNSVTPPFSSIGTTSNYINSTIIDNKPLVKRRLIVETSIPKDPILSPEPNSNVVDHNQTNMKKETNQQQLQPTSILGQPNHPSSTLKNEERVDEEDDEDKRLNQLEVAAGLLRKAVEGGLLRDEHNHELY